MTKKVLTLFSAVCITAMALVLAGYTLTACSSSNSSASASQTSSELSLAAGSELGTYYSYGNILAQYTTDNTSITINVHPSEGSKANIESLRSHEAELALCQFDVAALAYQGVDAFDGDAYTDFSVIAALYPEQIHLITYDPDIESVADLKGKTVSLGAADSGTYFSALDILDVYNLQESDVDAVYQNLTDSVDSLKNQQIDAGFITAGAPVPAITDLSVSEPLYVVGIDSDHVKKLTEKSPYYTQTVIEAGTYAHIGDNSESANSASDSNKTSGSSAAGGSGSASGGSATGGHNKTNEDTNASARDNTNTDIQTVAVLAVLLVNNSVNEDTVYALTKSLFECASIQNAELASSDNHAQNGELASSAQYASLSLNTAASITSLPYHVGAARYFSEQGIEVLTP